MKKIFIALAILASVQVANAQNSKVVAALDAAKEASQNAKKTTKVATWINLGKAYVAAYDAPTGNIIPGSSKQELSLLMGNERALSTEEVVLNGQAMTKEVYSNKNLYFRDGVLQMVEVTKPTVENALEGALEAYAKAHSIDSSKDKDIAAAIADIASKYANDAFTAYSLGDYATASKKFQKAFDASAVAPCAVLDTNSLYNAGFTAFQGGDYATAKAALTKCKDMKYFGDDGDVFAKLATIAEKSENKAEQKAILEEGFAAYPQSQSILIGLINYYITNKEDTNTLISLIGDAKKNEPNNASLYYVEGNIYKELGETAKAVEAYETCAKINPDYEYGYVYEGIMYYDMAVEIQEKAQAELDDAKYNALLKEFETTLKACIDPFKKAFNTTKDDNVKVSVAEYLKNACYRFRDESPEYAADYEKYKGISDSGSVQ